MLADRFNFIAGVCSPWVVVGVVAVHLRLAYLTIIL